MREDARRFLRRRRHGWRRVSRGPFARRHAIPSGARARGALRRDLSYPRQAPADIFMRRPRVTRTPARAARSRAHEPTLPWVVRPLGELWTTSPFLH